jgi:hypothetical protein
MSWLRRLFQNQKQCVYVLVANEKEKVKECFIVSTLDDAMKYRDKLTEIWGAANVCMASRKIGRVPHNLR